MKDFVFVSVAFGEAYIAQQDRLKESILAIYPDANLMFWRDELPPGSKTFLESLYGFKVHAIAKAKETYSRVLWLDPAMILQQEVRVLFGRSIVAVKDDNRLHNYISDKYLNWLGYSRESLKEYGWHLVGGSLYYFDFKSWQTCKIFDRWQAAEAQGYFGSQHEAASEQINSHRNDESCMAMTLYSHDNAATDAAEIGYCVERHPVFTKKHFK